MTSKGDKHRKWRIAVSMTLIPMLATTLLGGCDLLRGRPADEEAMSQASTLPNPASQYCQDQGYRWESREEAAGQVGYCLFPDGTECEEWAFYRGECAAGVGYQPLDPAACTELADAVRETIGVEVTTDKAPFEDFVGGETGTGCQAAATGTGVAYPDNARTPGRV